MEADETYVGGPKEGKSGRGAFGKQVVFIAAEVRGRKIGRIRLSHIPGVSGATLVPAVSEAVTAGATLRTDGWKGYNGVTAGGYKREVAVENADELADIVLLCGAQESPLDSGNIPVKVALLYVAEVLVLRYTMDDPENANAAQDRTSEALAVKML